MKPYLRLALKDGKLFFENLILVSSYFGKSLSIGKRITVLEQRSHRVLVAVDEWTE